MTVSEKKPRQNTGNHPDPLTEYPEARKRLESCADYPNARRPDGALVSTVLCDDLRAVLAGPPEPSEEGLVFEIMTDPAYLAEVRDEQQTWLAEHIVQIIQKARRA